jgi:hypothetical protein
MSDLGEDWMRDEILQIREARIAAAVDAMQPEQRPHFCKAIIQHLSTLELESPMMRARRDRVCLMLAALATEDDQEFR